MAQFLSAFLQSGLMDSMCGSAYFDIDDPGAKELFTRLAAEHFQNERVYLGQKEYSTSELYDVFLSMIKTTLSHLYNKSELAIASRAVSDLRTEIKKEQQSRTDRIFVKVHGQIDLSETKRKSPWFFSYQPSPSILVREFKTAIKSHFSTISVEGPHERNVERPIQDLYVPTKLSPYSFSPTFEFDNSKTASDSVSVFSATVSVFSATQEKQEFKAFFFDNSRILIVGDPGAGKSTLVRRICFELIDNNAYSAILPIFVALRRFYAEKTKSPQLPIISFIKSELARQSNKSAAEVSLALKYSLEYGSALILFDGLDEVIDIAHRREIVAEVTQFISTFSLCRYLVSSRIVGYEKAPIKDFVPLRVLPFSDSDVRQYYVFSATSIFEEIGQ